MPTIDDVLFRNPELAFCPHCQGTGRAGAFDDATIGLSVSAIRRRHDLTAKDVATVLGCSPQYLSDLERGRRAWSLDLVRRYKQAVGHILDVMHERELGETIP